MRNFYYGGEQGALTRETKQNWAQGRTTTDLYFVHGGVEPSKVLANGITPEYAREYLVHSGGPNDGERISGGKMIFTFQTCAGDQTPANATKNPVINTLWTYNGHSYLIKVPAGTDFWCQNGTLSYGKEIAFEKVFEDADIHSYWGPSNAYIKHGGGAPRPRQEFPRRPWGTMRAMYNRDVIQADRRGSVGV
ncbi:MAG: hypothetical protein AAF744_02600 [Pseudomonadota bacterium]